MLIYGYRGKKALNSEIYYCDSITFMKIRNYNDCPANFGLSEEDGKILARHIYRTYTTLYKLNNALVHIYILDEKAYKEISFVEAYLKENEDIINSPDIKCRAIYEKLGVWLNRLKNNPNSLDEIKWQVVRTMKFHEKQGIFTIASINLKSNYYDFVV